MSQDKGDSDRLTDEATQEDSIPGSCERVDKKTAKPLLRARSELALTKKYSRPSLIIQPSASSSKLPTLRSSAHQYSRNAPKLRHQKPSSEHYGRCDLSCSDEFALNPVQLQEIFNLIDNARREWPSMFRASTQTPDSTSEDSVDGTCIAANLSSHQFRSHAGNEEGIKAGDCESLGMARLKAEISILCDNFVRVMLEMEKIQLAIDNVSEERDVLKKRECAHERRIKSLTFELEDSRARYKTQAAEDKIQLKQLRIENELFASQIIDNEVELREIRTILEFMDEENDMMRIDLNKLERSQAHDHDENLRAEIDALTNRITEMERRHTNGYVTLEDANQASQDLSKVDQSAAGENQSCSISDTDDELSEQGIEINLNGDVVKPKEVSEAMESRLCICCPCMF